MKQTSWIAAFCAALSAGFAIVSFYFAYVFHFAVDIRNSPALTTDQILGCLTVMIGLVGLIVAVAAIAIAIIAVFGFGEIRQITARRTDELFKNFIGNLRKRRQITTAEAAELWHGIQDDGFEEYEPEPASTTDEQPPTTDGNGANEAIEEYPAGKEDSK